MQKNRLGKILSQLVLALGVSLSAATAHANTGLFQIDAGPEFAYLNSGPGAPVGGGNPAPPQSGLVGGLRISLAAGVENRYWAIVGTARLSLNGGDGEGQNFYGQLHIGATFHVRLGRWVRLGAGPELGFHVSPSWNPGADGGEYQLGGGFDIGATLQLTIDLLQRRNGSALYLSLYNSYVYSPDDFNPQQAYSLALSLGYRFSSRHP